MNEDSDRALRERPRLDYYESSNSDLDESVNGRSTSSTSVESNTSFVTALTIGDEATASIDNSVFVSMDNPRYNQLVAELETIFFQLEEIKDIVENELGTMSLKSATSQYDELKELRVNMVRFGQELKLLLQGEDANDFPKKVAAACQTSREHLKMIKNRVSELEHVESDKLSEAREAEYHRLRSKRLAFDTMVKEINGMYVRLYAAYTTKPINLSRDEMLKRKEDKPVLASEFDRFRERVDKLVSTDVFFEQKEKVIAEVIHLLSMLEGNKFAYEKKVYDDLVANDLTDDKRKLAELTTIDIGYFSGELGEDFYTFKSKFLKAYERHPKSLMVDWLKNNHLKGKAKSCVGSLDEIDGIWKRLKDNYGNTEQMLLYHFDKINRLGTMNKQKSYTLKKQYLQTLINSMQDAIDLAKEHKLEGELHYGPQLGKIVTQLESYMQNVWYKLITEESVAKPNRWLRLIIFLESQLSIVQTRAFEAESADLQLAQQLSKSDIDSKREADTKQHFEKVKKQPLSLVVEKEECGLCSETHYSANKSYFNCKRFLTISRKERCVLVRNNKHCLQCLHSKSRWNEGEHECSDKWICKNDSHNKHEKKLHFFICEFHTDDNNQLFEEWKVEILKAEWQQKMFKNRSYIVNSIYLNKKKNINEGPEIQESDGSEPEVKGNEIEVSMPSGQEKSVVEEIPKVEPTLDVIPDAAGFGSPVFLLQPVPYNNYVFNFFYDSGCKTFVSRKTAIDMLPDKNKRNTVEGPIAIYGVGGASVTSQYGHYSIDFPIHDGRMATFSGLCLDTITGGMPPYPVREARKTLVESYVATGGKESELPQVPLLVGGDTDFLMGPQYNWFLPRLLFILPTGLAIYESMFKGVNGTRGCIGGSHELFTQCEEQFLGTHMVTEFRAYLTQQLSLYSTGYRICLDYDSLTLNNVLNPHCIAIVNIDSELKTPKALLTPTTSNDAEAAGSVIEYKCIKCRGCNDCKRGEHIENVSVREEYEQHIIDNSVSVDFDKQQTIATLPFIADPVEKLQSNEENANRVYSQQLKKLSKVHHSVKDAVIESEMKLQKCGHVEWIKNLPTKELDMLNSFVSKYYMPWRFVFNENSISTPVRVVFDASSISRSGYSLNDLLAKGINSINSLLKIFLRFRCAPVAVHTDIKKMYNVVKLKPEHWTYQRYKWQEDLDPSVPPEEKIIKTLIYGVKPSGNQAQVGLRETARRQENVYPNAANAVINDIYVDDCATGVAGTENTSANEEAEHLVTEIDLVIGKGGFVTKGYTISGKPPLSSLSADGESINVFGFKWYPENDYFKVAVGPPNFAKKIRGRREITEHSWKIPEKLTKRICSSKYGEVFDVSGLVAPIMGGFKIDIRQLINDGLGWDNIISNLNREEWAVNFQLMSEMGKLVYNRAVIPEDAASLDFELIAAGDASTQLVCAGCYIRYSLKDGGYSCQLLLGKTKIVPENMTLPRAELFAATLNVHVLEILKRSLRNNCIDYLCVTDSEIALYWITSQTKRQKPYVRNRAIEVNRFTKPTDWYHISSEMNPADIGTRKGASIEDVDQNSQWLNGKTWMVLPFTDLRDSHLRSVDQIKYEKEQMDQINNEMMGPDVVSLCCSNFEELLLNENTPIQSTCFFAGGSSCFVGADSDISMKVSERLAFSNYLIDPNKYRFDKVVRIMALVIKFAKIWLSKIQTMKELSRYTYVVDLTNAVVLDHVTLLTLTCSEIKPSDTSYLMPSDTEMYYAMDYFFQKATEEVKKFMRSKDYEQISFEKNNILYYDARVSPCDVDFRCTMTKVMLDLSAGTFVVPLVERHSPLAYAIINQIHWYHPTVRHRGVETTIRQVMTVACIFGVRDLVKLFRKQCARCRYLLKVTVDVEMAPASKHQICVAPPFYITQTDLCGPFSSYSKHNKRTTVKVWISVYVCTTTSMTNLKIMDGYDTTQFLMAFSRFACEVGFPSKLLVDPGSQIVKGCEEMSLNMCNMRGALKRECGVDFDKCPVGGHNYQGKVERKIRVIKESISKTAHLQRLSTLQWETLCSEIANSINNHPVAIGNETQDLESLDLITPNRLRLGRNNDRSPVGTLDLTDKVDRILQMNSDIFNTWWENWLVSALPKIVPKPKWFKNDEHLKVGDIVLFNKGEGSLLAGEYQYGAVEKVHVSADGRIRSVTIKYRNFTEGVNRSTTRAVRSLIVIHRIDELNIMEELGKASFINSQ